MKGEPGMSRDENKVVITVCVITSDDSCHVAVSREIPPSRKGADKVMGPWHVPPPFDAVTRSMPRSMHTALSPFPQEWTVAPDTVPWHLSHGHLSPGRGTFPWHL